jgi:hypothetical protein
MMNHQKGAIEPWVITVAGILIILFIILFLLFFFSRNQPTQNAPATTGSYVPLNPSSSSFGTSQVNHQTLGNIPYPSTAVPNAPISNAPVQTPIQVAPQQNYQIETVQNIPISSAPFITDTVATQNTDYATVPDVVYNPYMPTLISLTPNPNTPSQSTQTTVRKSGGGGGSGDNTLGILTTVGVSVIGLLVGGVVGLAIGALLGGGLGSLLGGGGGGGLGGLLGGFGGGGGSGNFGGQITNVTYCTCSGASELLYIQDVASKQQLQLLYQPGQSTLYANYNISQGANVLGSYSGGGQCQVYSGEECQSQGNPQGTITMIGTSQ